MTIAQQPAPQPAGQGEPLTPRELEIAGLVAQALTDRQIAYKLHVSPFTVRVHVDNVLWKLGLPNRVAICRWWFLNCAA